MYTNPGSTGNTVISELNNLGYCQEHEAITKKDICRMTIMTFNSHFPVLAAFFSTYLHKARFHSFLSYSTQSDVISDRSVWGWAGEGRNQWFANTVAPVLTSSSKTVTRQTNMKHYQREKKCTCITGLFSQ